MSTHLLLLSELEGLGTLFAIILFIMFGPPLILLIAGLMQWSREPKKAKTLFIIGGVYLLVGLGICGMLMS